MGPGKRPSPTAGAERVGVVLLAAGYGTRLQRDLRAHAHLSALAATPKPLLPLCGAEILSHWLAAARALPAPAPAVVVTNAAHRARYRAWADARPAAPVTVVCDGSRSNDARRGAVAAIALGLRALRPTPADLALIVAGDTLLPAADLPALVARFARGPTAAAAVAYELSDPADCARRGMFAVRRAPDGAELAERLVEKPPTPADAPSRLASAPLYLLRRSAWASVDQFLADHERAPLHARDAPGLWLAWLVPRLPVALLRVDRRVDIGGLRHYMDALWELATSARGLLPGERPARAPQEPAVGRAYPRVGLLGNPSDGYGGKVVAAAVASEGYAEVVAVPHPRFVVHPNPAHELPADWQGIAAFVDDVDRRGLRFSARDLVLAAAAVFAKEFGKHLAARAGDVTNKDPSSQGLSALPGCQLVYSTTIPARIGLSGSSALVLATFRALARFYSTSLEMVNKNLHAWPLLMQSAETDLLGIACGLQDRVVQVMQGCVAMDFSPTAGPMNARRWVRLPESALPPLWIAYHEGGQVGECSGTVHGDLKARFRNKDPAVLDVVEQLRGVADAGCKMLEQKAAGRENGLAGFADLVRKNFELRLRLVGREGVGKGNIELVNVAKEAGFAAKMTGSGGCALCVPDPVRELSEDEVLAAVTTFKRHGAVLRRVEILPRRDWSV